MELSQLSIKCFANMPMLADTITKAINELYNIFEPYHEEYWNLLEKWINSDERTRFSLGKKGTGIINTFGGTSTRGEIMRIDFEISFYKDVKTYPIDFSTVFGYWLDDTQNSIYFQLFENSETSFIEELQQSKDFVKSKSLSQEYQYGNENGKTVWVEFTVDETLSLGKIKTCSELFKTNILMPILKKLK